MSLKVLADAPRSSQGAATSRSSKFSKRTTYV